jgi:hypothetical protein
MHVRAARTWAATRRNGAAAATSASARRRSFIDAAGTGLGDLGLQGRDKAHWDLVFATLPVSDRGRDCLSIGYSAEREREAGVQLLALLLTLTTAPCAGRHQGAFVNGFLFYFMKKSGRSRTARSLRVAGLGEKRGNAYLLWRTVLCCFYDYEILWMELSKLHWVHFV